MWFVVSQALANHRNNRTQHHHHHHHHPCRHHHMYISHLFSPRACHPFVLQQHTKGRSEQPPRVCPQADFEPTRTTTNAASSFRILVVDRVGVRLWLACYLSIGGACRGGCRLLRDHVMPKKSKALQSQLESVCMLGSRLRYLMSENHTIA